MKYWRNSVRKNLERKKSKTAGAKLRQSEKTWPAYRSYSKGRQSKSSSLIAARKSRLPMCRNECAIPEAEWFFYFHFLIRNVIIVKRLVGKQLRLH